MNIIDKYQKSLRKSSHSLQILQKNNSNKEAINL